MAKAQKQKSGCLTPIIALMFILGLSSLGNKKENKQADVSTPQETTIEATEQATEPPTETESGTIPETTETETEATTEPETESETESETEPPTEAEVNEVTGENFIADVKEVLQGRTEEGEIITNVTYENRKLTVYADVSNAVVYEYSDIREDAVYRSANLTDFILRLSQYDELWDEIIIDFGEAGKVINPKSAVTENSFARFFDYEKITVVSSTGEIMTEEMFY